MNEDMARIDLDNILGREPNATELEKFLRAVRNANVIANED